MALSPTASLTSTSRIQRAILPDVTHVVAGSKEVTFEFKFRPLRFLPLNYVVVPRTRIVADLVVAMETQGVSVTPDGIASDDRLLFKGSETARFPPYELARLSARMTEADSLFFKKGIRADNMMIPAGYTYLAQFVNHDALYNARLLGRPSDISASKRPQLNLDSLYGPSPSANSKLYQPAAGGALHFRLGSTANGRGRDLPRGEDGIATIPEQRNDNNFIVAQLTALFMLFHNCLTDRYNLPFESAREQVTLHYQSAIIGDLLPRLLNAKILERIKTERDPIYGSARGEYVPYEFSNAAFRLHTMTRSRYQINRQRYLDFTEVLRTTGAGAPDLFPLDPNLSIDWSLFFPSSQQSADPLTNFSRPIDPYVAPELLNFVLTDLSIDTQRLLKLPLGWPPTLGLVDVYTSNGLVPSAQTALSWLRWRGHTLQSLGPLEIGGGILSELSQLDFIDRTPLFYYVLKEAEVLEDGQRLGPLGSTIVGETIFGLLCNDKRSILHRETWRPLIPLARPNVVSMTDLVSFVMDT